MIKTPSQGLKNAQLFTDRISESFLFSDPQKKTTEYQNSQESLELGTRDTSDTQEHLNNKKIEKDKSLQGVNILEDLYCKHPNNSKIYIHLINSLYKLDLMDRAMFISEKNMKHYTEADDLQKGDLIENNAIQTLWIGSSLSTIERLCLSSFLYYGHEVHLYCYNTLSNIPAGVIVKDANTIIDEADIFYTGNNSLAHFADYFRWELLFHKGGYWVDTDVICLKPFKFTEDYVYGFETDEIVGSALLKVPQYSRLAHMMSAICANPNLILPHDTDDDINRKKKRVSLNQAKQHTGWGEAGGPIGLSRALKYFDLLCYAKPFTYFYPVHHSSWQSIYNETFKENQTFFNHTYAIHLWNEMARRADFDKNAIFPYHSFIEKLKRKYFV